MKQPNPPTPFPKREGGASGRNPPANNIVVGQSVDEVKVLRAKQLRREMTPAESLLWARLRRNQLGGLHFRRQQVIDGFIADFYCHAAGAVIEVDGSVHDGQAEYDAERTGIFQARGLRVHRFSNHDILTRLDHVLSEIVRCCSQDRSGSTASD